MARTSLSDYQVGHVLDKNNPHEVTATQIGALNILNEIKTVDGEDSGLNSDTVDDKHWADIKYYIDNAALNFKINYIADGTVDGTTGYYYMKVIPDNPIGTDTIVTTVDASPKTIAKFITMEEETIELLLSGMYYLNFTAEKTAGTADVSVSFKIYEVDGGESLIMTSNDSVNITDKQNYIIGAFSADDYYASEGKQFVLELIAETSGGGSTPEVTVYYSPTDILSMTIPTSLDIASAHYVKLEDFNDHATDTNNPHSVTASQVGALTSVADDTTPVLGGELDAGENTIVFTERVNTSSGGAVTIDWTKSNHQTITLTENTTLAFANPSNPCNLTLRIKQDTTGGWTVTLPTIKTSGGASLSFTTTSNAEDLLMLYFDGTNYIASLLPDIK